MSLSPLPDPAGPSAPAPAPPQCQPPSSLVPLIDEYRAELKEKEDARKRQRDQPGEVLACYLSRLYPLHPGTHPT